MSYNCPSMEMCNSTIPGPSLAQICSTSTFFVFLTLLEELMRSNDKISGRCERIIPIENPDAEYDFVVIGGGGAGSAAAGRLSENPDFKVLVVEAGPDVPIASQVPLFATPLYGSAVDWNFTTNNEEYACFSINGSCPLNSGKLLGGSTSYNAMVYLRGVPKDYDNWAAQGNDGWSWEEVKEFYLKSEDNQDIEMVGRKYHATGGPLSVGRFPYTPSFAYSMLAASEEVGYGISEDLNGEKFNGIAITQATQKNGVRASSAAAFLRSARNRPNLHVSLESFATRIIIENKKAVGVEYLQNGELKRVRVSKEVIVSAGALKSPQILLLSGIGPRKHLESMGVEVVKHLPGVGKNLHDHVGFTMEFSIDDVDTYDNDWAIATEYLVNQTGPLSSFGTATVIANLNSPAASPDHPDFQLHFGSHIASCAPGQIGALHSSGKRTVIGRIINLHPKSRGSVTLWSKDPTEYPRIQVNYLKEPSDVELMIHAIETALKFIDTEALRAHNFTLNMEPMEVCANYTFPSAEYWTCALRHVGDIGDLHYAGSSKMGTESDPMAVVDPELRVHGMEGLRVADNSIMPQVISGNTAAPAMMIGERVADFIKKHWAQKCS